MNMGRGGGSVLNSITGERFKSLTLDCFDYFTSYGVPSVYEDITTGYLIVTVTD